MLSNDELTDMRNTIQDFLLPDTCNLLSLSSSSDGAGGFTDTWGTATANLACRLDTQNGRYTDLDGGVQTYKKLVLSIPYNATITEANRIEYGSNIYQVISVNEGSWLAVKRAEVEKI
jgi:hypothetical protein